MEDDQRPKWGFKNKGLSFKAPDHIERRGLSFEDRSRQAMKPLTPEEIEARDDLENLRLMDSNTFAERYLLRLRDRNLKQ